MNPCRWTPGTRQTRPGWRDAFPAFTHNLSWQDADGCTHSLTLRSDDLQDLLDDLKLIKAAIRQAKAWVKSQETPAESQDVMHCHIHDVDMPRRWSKRTGGHYFAHKLATGDFCYGKAKP